MKASCTVLKTSGVGDGPAEFNIQQPMGTLDQIKTLIFDLRGSYKFELTADTLLQRDLGIYGVDAYDFIERFGEEFYIDVSEFNYRKYFAGEGGILTPWLIPNADFGTAPLTLGDLVLGVEVGKLQ